MSDREEAQTPEQRLEAARSWASESGSIAVPAGASGVDPGTDRLQVVIAAAERAADAIRFDAEQQARRHLIDAQRKADEATAERLRAISDLTDELIEQAGAVRHHSQQMIAALEQATGAISAGLPAGATGARDEEPAAIGGGSREGDDDPAPTPVLDQILAGAEAEQPADPPAPRQGAAPAAERSTPSTGVPAPRVTLRVTQLAMAGESRERIAEAIAAEFDVDPEPVLDRLLGP